MLSVDFRVQVLLVLRNCLWIWGLLWDGNVSVELMVDGLCGVWGLCRARGYRGRKGCFV